MALWFKVLLMAGLVCQTCSALYTRKPFYIEDEHRPGGHLEFLQGPPPKIYPLTSHESAQLYAKLKNRRRSPSFFDVSLDSKINFNPYNYAPGGVIKGCCGNEWSGSNGQNELVAPKFLLSGQGLHQNGYQSNQVQGYGQGFGGDVKPVVEHIEDDLKYDFRTNTHTI